jgi:hypothetical protein
LGVYEDSHWVEGYTARIRRVDTASQRAAIIFSWNELGPVPDWHELWHHPAEMLVPGVLNAGDTVSPLVTHALIAWRDQYDVELRVTNDGLITGIRTAGLQRHDSRGKPIYDSPPTLGQIIDAVIQILRLHDAAHGTPELSTVGQGATGHAPFHPPPIPNG